MGHLQEVTKEIESPNRKKKDRQEENGIPPILIKERKENQEDYRDNHERDIGNPVMKDRIKDTKERARILRMKGIHQGLAFVM